MKLIITAIALVAGIPMAAYAAPTDHSQHEQHQQQPAPQGQTAKPAPHAHQHGGMGEGMHDGMHQGMKMDGCCCCKKEAQQAQKPCCDKNEAPGSAPSDQSHDHNH